MFAIDKTDLQRFAVSAVGALALSTASILAAVGPARAATPATDSWTAAVEQKIAATDPTAAGVMPIAPKAAAIRLTFTDAGNFAGATLARTSGNPAVDSRALRLANRIAYPALPAAYRGRAVTLLLATGASEEDAQRQLRQAPRVEVLARRRQGAEVAAR